MLINKNYIALLFSLQSTINSKLTGVARIVEVEFFEKNETDQTDAIKANVKVWFGPTHQLTMVFDGTVDTRDRCLGNTWSLSYNDGEVRASITSQNLHDDDALKRIKADLGI